MQPSRIFAHHENTHPHVTRCNRSNAVAAGTHPSQTVHRLNTGRLSSVDNAARVVAVADDVGGGGGGGTLDGGHAFVKVAKLIDGAVFDARRKFDGSVVHCRRILIAVSSMYKCTWLSSKYRYKFFAGRVIDRSIKNHGQRTFRSPIAAIRLCVLLFKKANVCICFHVCLCVVDGKPPDKLSVAAGVVYSQPTSTIPQCKYRYKSCENTHPDALSVSTFVDTRRHTCGQL